MDLASRFNISPEQLAEFCRRHRIRRLALFGSVLREDFRADSDIDVLVEFEPGARVGLIKLAGIELELSKLAQRKVDLRTPADLSRYFRQTVLETAQERYASR
jgi:predicted nucleotidyltransferase